MLAWSLLKAVGGFSHGEQDFGPLQHKPSHVRRMEAFAIATELETGIGQFFKALPCDGPGAANWRTLWLADGGYFYVLTKAKAKVCSRAFTTETYVVEARSRAKAFNAIENRVTLGYMPCLACRGIRKSTMLPISNHSAS